MINQINKTTKNTTYFTILIRMTFFFKIQEYKIIAYSRLFSENKGNCYTIACKYDIDRNWHNGAKSTYERHNLLIAMHWQ